MYVYTCVELCRVCRNRGDPQWGDCCIVVSIVWKSSVSFWSHDRSVVPGVKLGASTSMHGASVEQIVITKKRHVCRCLPLLLLLLLPLFLVLCTVHVLYMAHCMGGMMYV